MTERDQQRKAFTFFESFYESVSILDDSDQDQFFGALVRYAFTGEYPDKMNPYLHSLFILAKPNIDKSVENHVNGKKGGRPAKKNKKQ